MGVKSALAPFVRQAEICGLDDPEHGSALVVTQISDVRDG